MPPAPAAGLPAVLDRRPRLRASAPLHHALVLPPRPGARQARPPPPSARHQRQAPHPPLQKRESIPVISPSAYPHRRGRYRPSRRARGFARHPKLRNRLKASPHRAALQCPPHPIQPHPGRNPAPPRRVGATPPAHQSPDATQGPMHQLPRASPPHGD